MDIRRFGPGHRRADGPQGTKGVTGQVIHHDDQGLVSELAFQRYAMITPHSNPNMTLFIVISGGGYVQVGDERERVNHGEAIVWPPNVPHGAYTDGSEMRAIVVELPRGGDTMILEGAAAEVLRSGIQPAAAKAAPPAAAPATDLPPTDLPPTAAPPTAAPPTDLPPTDLPPTDLPPTDLPPTDLPADDPAADDPAADDPSAGEPAADEPAADPATDLQADEPPAAEVTAGRPTLTRAEGRLAERQPLRDEYDTSQGEPW